MVSMSLWEEPFFSDAHYLLIFFYALCVLCPMIWNHGHIRNWNVKFTIVMSILPLPKWVTKWVFLNFNSFDIRRWWPSSPPKMPLKDKTYTRNEFPIAKLVKRQWYYVIFYDDRLKTSDLPTAETAVGGHLGFFLHVTGAFLHDRRKSSFGTLWKANQS